MRFLIRLCNSNVGFASTNLAQPRSWTLLAVASASLLMTAAAVQAADQAKSQAPEAKQVELFAAMKGGDVEVKLIPRNVREANVLIENKRDKPLQIKLPDAFAGVPVLAQRGMGGMGGMGMGGMGGMGMRGMGGMMNVDPGKIAKIKVATVCLEHGKQDPNPRVPYELRPIETFTENAQVIEVCKMLGRGEVPQNAAQAAAWHLTNGLSWDVLVNKDKIHLSNGYTEKYFSPAEINVAIRVVAEASRRVQAERGKVTETSASTSSK